MHLFQNKNDTGGRPACLRGYGRKCTGLFMIGAFLHVVHAVALPWLTETLQITEPLLAVISCAFSLLCPAGATSQFPKFSRILL